MKAPQNPENILELYKYCSKDIEFKDVNIDRMINIAILGTLLDIKKTMRENNND